MLNKQGKDKIDWTDWTLNIIGGSCKMRCDYCYMKRIEKRFNKNYSEPFFRENYLKSLKSKNLKDGDKIFIGSSNDMFADYIPLEWIQRIFDEIKKYSQYTYQFLTKNPKRYNEIPYCNHWLGITIDTKKRLQQYYKDLAGMSIKGNMFISYEPLLEDVNEIPKWCQWIIIGANSNPGSKKAPDEWCDNLIKIARKLNIPVWVKDNYNYHTRIKEDFKR